MILEPKLQGTAPKTKSREPNSKEGKAGDIEVPSFDLGNNSCDTESEFVLENAYKYKSLSYPLSDCLVLCALWSLAYEKQQCLWSGVFGSTVRANQNYLSERGAGVLPACFYLFCHPTVVCHPTVACQDFSNQIYWWSHYTKECSKHGVKKGRVVTAQVAEFMQGGQFFGLPFLVFHSCRPAARVDRPATKCSEGQLGLTLPMDGSPS